MQNVALFTLMVVFLIAVLLLAHKAIDSDARARNTPCRPGYVRIAATAGYVCIPGYVPGAL